MLDKIRKLLNLPSGGERELFPIYVLCQNCGKPHSTRVHLFRDLSFEFDQDGEPAGYVCRKTLVSGRDCFARIQVTLNFDRNRKLIHREIVGGEFMTEDQFVERTQDLPG